MVFKNFALLEFYFKLRHCMNLTFFLFDSSFCLGFLRLVWKYFFFDDFRFDFERKKIRVLTSSPDVEV